MSLSVAMGGRETALGMKFLRRMNARQVENPQRKWQRNSSIACSSRALCAPQAGVALPLVAGWLWLRTQGKSSSNGRGCDVADDLEQQIPFGNDNKKGKSNGKNSSNGKNNCNGRGYDVTDD